MTMDFSAQRLSYDKGQLIETDLPKSPRALLESWVHTAVDNKIIEPYAMSFATCGSDGQPSVRTLLMREITELDDDGFGIVFYTNYNSAKGIDIEQNPKAQTLFFWHALERQVRISGKVRKLSQQKSTEYFHKRPLDSQVAAWVSNPQSGVVASRNLMEESFQSLEEKYAGIETVPMPEFWGGYEIVATEIEFWQGRAGRMHDRIVYRRQDSEATQNSQTEQESISSPDSWVMERLLP